MTSVKSPSPGGAGEGHPRGGGRRGRLSRAAFHPRGRVSAPPGCLCDPLNPPNAAVHVPTGSAPMGCEKSGSADGTPRK